MPLKVTINSKTQWIHPTNNWKKTILNTKILKFSTDKNFYIDTIQL